MNLPWQQRLDYQVGAVLTGFVGTRHAHLGDGGDDGVVAAALADQVDDPVCDVLDGAAVQAVVVGRLQGTAAKPSVAALRSQSDIFLKGHSRCRRGSRCSPRTMGRRLWTPNAPRRNS